MKNILSKRGIVYGPNPLKLGLAGKYMHPSRRHVQGPIDLTKMCTYDGIVGWSPPLAQTCSLGDDMGFNSHMSQNVIIT